MFEAMISLAKYSDPMWVERKTTPSSLGGRKNWPQSKRTWSLGPLGTGVAPMCGCGSPRCRFPEKRAKP